MRVIVCGSRGWTDRAPIINRLAELPDPGSVTIVVGYDPTKDKPSGVDRIAYQEAQKAGLQVEAYPADDFIVRGKVGGDRAPLERNKHMASLGADLCIAFHDGRSTGTAHMMTQARNMHIPVEVITA